MLFLAATIGLFTANKVADEKGAAADELAIYNQLLNDLYNPGQCQQFVKPPYMACCNADGRMMMEDYVSCCGESPIPEKYRVFCQACINLGELDSMQLVMDVRDSLYALEWEEPMPYLLEKLDSSLGFLPFIKQLGASKPSSSLAFDPASLKQSVTELKAITGSAEERTYGTAKLASKPVTFRAPPPVMSKKDRKEKLNFGRNGKQLLLGVVSLSRIYFNTANDKGILQFGYRGGNNCGEVSYVLIEKQGNEWKKVQHIVYSTF